MSTHIIDREGHSFERPCEEHRRLESTMKQWFTIYSGLLVLLIALVGWAITSAQSVRDNVYTVENQSSINQERWRRMEEDIREIKTDVAALAKPTRLGMNQ